MCGVPRASVIVAQSFRMSMNSTHSVKYLLAGCHFLAHLIISSSFRNILPVLPCSPLRGSLLLWRGGPLYPGLSGSFRSLLKSLHGGAPTTTARSLIPLMSSSVISSTLCLPLSPRSTPGNDSVLGLAAWHTLCLSKSFSMAMTLVIPWPPVALSASDMPPIPSKSDRTVAPVSSVSVEAAAMMQPDGCSCAGIGSVGIVDNSYRRLSGFHRIGRCLVLRLARSRGVAERSRGAVKRLEGVEAHPRGLRCELSVPIP